MFELMKIIQKYENVVVRDNMGYLYQVLRGKMYRLPDRQEVKLSEIVERAKEDFKIVKS